MTNDDLVSTAERAIWSEGDTSRRGEFHAVGFQAHYFL